MARNTKAYNEAKREIKRYNDRVYYYRKKGYDISYLSYKSISKKMSASELRGIKKNTMVNTGSKMKKDYISSAMPRFKNATKYLEQKVTNAVKGKSIAGKKLNSMENARYNSFKEQLNKLQGIVSKINSGLNLTKDDLEFAKAWSNTAEKDEKEYRKWVYEQIRIRAYAGAMTTDEAEEIIKIMDTVEDEYQFVEMCASEAVIKELLEIHYYKEEYDDYTEYYFSAPDKPVAIRYSSELVRTIDAIVNYYKW